MPVFDYIIPSRRRVLAARDAFLVQQLELKTRLATRINKRMKSIAEADACDAPAPWSPTANWYGGNFGQIGSGPLIDDDSGSLFDPIAYQTEDAIDSASFREAQRRAFKLTVQSPLAYGWIETAVQHIVGDKFQMKSLDHDPATQAAWDQQAENMAGPHATYAWPFRIQAQDSVRAALRLGDDMLLFNVNPYDGGMNMREMEPIFVYDRGSMWPYPTNTWTPNMMSTFGIQTDPFDMDVITAYWYDAFRNGNLQQIPSSNVHHTKYNATRRMKRGRFWLLPVIKPLLRLDKTLEARALMHLNRAEMSFHYETTEGTDPTMLLELLKDNQVSTGYNAGSQYATEPGSMEFLSKVKKVYTNPNLEAGDARYDILTQMQPIARALGLSMQTAFGITDATMATAREANLPEILMFEWAQDWFFQMTFLPIARRCIEEKIKAGMLDPLSYKETDEISGPVEHNIRSKSREIVPRNTGFEGSFPAVRVPDVKALTDAILAQRMAYIIDDEEAMTRLGYDAQLMKNRVETQRRQDLQHAEVNGALAELQAMAGMNGTNGAEPHTVGKNGRSDSKAGYRHSGTKS